MVTKGAVGSRQEFPRGCCPEAVTKAVTKVVIKAVIKVVIKVVTKVETKVVKDNPLDSHRGCCLPKEVGNPVAVALS